MLPAKKTLGLWGSAMTALTVFRATLAGLALLTAAAAPAIAAPFSEPDTVRWGADYRAVALKSGGAETCKRLCAEESMCRAWSYHRAGTTAGTDLAVCRLKSAIPAAQASPCCVSGVMVGTSEPANRTARAASKTSAQPAVSSKPAARAGNPAPPSKAAPTTAAPTKTSDAPRPLPKPAPADQTTGKSTGEPPAKTADTKPALDVRGSRYAPRLETPAPRGTIAPEAEIRSPWARPGAAANPNAVRPGTKPSSSSKPTRAPTQPVSAPGLRLREEPQD